MLFYPHRFYTYFLTLPIIFSRLKKVQGKKKRDAEAAEVARIKAAASNPGVENIGVGGGAEVGDLLDSKDADVIF